jgi:5-hydroxyisourate hydrolase-like protein (transthyretin family)
LFFRVKLTFKVDDEFGTELVKAFDDAFLNVVELNLFSNVSTVRFLIVCMLIFDVDYPFLYVDH